jgi:hypothetical protein
MNQLQIFLTDRFTAAPGCAVPIASIVTHFNADNPGSEISPDAIRGYLESRFPIGIFLNATMVGNLKGEGSIIAADRELVVDISGELLPRDIRPDEFEWYIRQTKYRPRTRTLSRTQMTVRGWNRRVLSRAQRMAGMKESDK